MDRERLLQTLAGIGRPSLTVIGDIVLDKYVFGNVERLSPEAPVPVLDVTGERYVLGGAANVANNLHALGAEVRLCGLCGDDREAETLRGLLAERGLASDCVIADASRPTTVKTRIIGHGQQIVRMDHEARHDSSGSVRERLQELVGGGGRDADGIIVSDYGKGVITPALLDFVRELRARSGMPVVVDPKDIHFQHYRQFSIITPNTAEASLGAGFKIKDEATLLEAGLRLRRDLDLDAMLITRSAQGMSLFRRDLDPLHIPTVARDVFDVTGAGDTVSGVIALALSSGLAFDDAAYLANFAASVVVGKFGTATLDRDELRAAIEDHGAPR